MIIGKFVELCKAQNRQRRLIDLLRAICACNDEAVINNQNGVVKLLFEHEDNRNFLMMPIRQKSPTEVEVWVHQKVTGVWMSLSDY